MDPGQKLNKKKYIYRSWSFHVLSSCHARTCRACTGITNVDSSPRARFNAVAMSQLAAKSVRHFFPRRLFAEKTFGQRKRLEVSLAGCWKQQIFILSRSPLLIFTFLWSAPKKLSIVSEIFNEKCVNSSPLRKHCRLAPRHERHSVASANSNSAAHNFTNRGRAARRNTESHTKEDRGDGDSILVSFYENSAAEGKRLNYKSYFPSGGPFVRPAPRAPDTFGHKGSRPFLIQFPFAICVGHNVVQFACPFIGLMQIRIN